MPKKISTADELEKLIKLKKDGIISEEEFKVEKKKLLGDKQKDSQIEVVSGTDTKPGFFGQKAGCGNVLLVILVLGMICAFLRFAYPLMIGGVIVYCIAKYVNKESKYKVIGIVVTIIIAIIGEIILANNLPLNTDTTSTTPTSVTSTSNSSNDTPVVEKIPDPEQITLKGKGDSVTKKQTLRNGYALLKITHTGSHNFAVYVHSTGEDINDLTINEIGNYSGTRLLEVDSSKKYYFEINADGDWSIKITQPTTTTVNAPTTLSGVGSQVKLINMNKGDHSAKIKHTGSHNFAVYFIDQYSSLWSRDLVINEIGNYKGTVLLNASKNGLYYLEVEADGNWTAQIE
jgi:hypothetical protein